MTRPLRTACFLLGLTLLIRAPALAEPARSICPLGEVRAGQRAVGKSVFRGTRVESFNLEVLGVLHKFDGTRSVILARVLDGPVVARSTGVIGGMSGSPVYIGGRLAGAIALTWPWSKEPIAGITPIEEMLGAFDERSAAQDEPRRASGGTPSGPFRLQGRVINRVRVLPTPPAEPDPPGSLTLVPLSGYVQASGFSARGIERLSDLVSTYGLRVTPGPMGDESQMRPPLVPGASLGAKMITGDFDMTALGTVTLVEGDRVLGFGHPLLERGAVDLPMTGGYVHDVLPSLYVSNKMMSPTKVVGRVFHDHQSAVAGELGAMSDLLPVSIEVVDNDYGRSREFDVEVVRARELMPGLVATSVMSAVDETRGRIARGTARVSVEIDAENRPPIRREELSYSDSDAAAATAPAVIVPLTRFTDSRFGELRINEVRIRVEAEEVRNTATIERVTVSQSRVVAGDEVTFNVTVRPYGRDLVDVPLRVALPPDLPRGQVRVVVSGGDGADQARAAIGAPRPVPIAMSQLIERYTTQEQSSDLVLRAALPRQGVSLLGQELPALPRSALDVLRATHATDLRPSPSLLTVVVPTQWVLYGREALVIQVDSPISPARPGPPPPPGEGPPGDGEKEAALFDALSPAPVRQVRLMPTLPPGLLGAGAQRPAEAAAKEEKELKPFTRAPKTWVQQDASDHARADLNNIAVDEDGRISLAPECAQVASLPSDAVWSLAVRDGATYVGTGNEGRIYRVSSEGDASEFCATGEMNVHAMAFDDGGCLYAATSPRGRLFRISPDGEAELAYDTESTYLWCLALSPDGTIYAGGGAPARIYAMDPNSEKRVLVDLPAANVVSLALSRTGTLYAGTSDNGVIYRVRADGTAAAVCQAPGAAAAALALDDDETLYAASSPGGDIYRIAEAGQPELYCETDRRTIYGLALLEDGDLAGAAGAGDLLIRIGSDRAPEVLLRSESGLGTAIAQADGALHLGTSAPCLLYKVGPGQAPAGELESEVFDAGRTARWGRMDWLARMPEGARVDAATRSGDSPLPDDHWTPWTALGSDRAIASPPARYLQYQLRLATEDTATTPVVEQMRISHRPQNRRPACALKTPKGGVRLSKKATVAWQGRDPDNDALSYGVAISSDVGETWEHLKQNLREDKYEWDTTEQEDGRYLLRVTASDALSAPSEPQSAKASAAIWVDNTAPEVGLLRSSLIVSEDGRVEVSGWARDALSPVRSVEYRVDDGNWTSLALSGIESSLAGVYVTDVSIATEALDAASHSLEIRAFDAAGNVATDSMQVEVAERKQAVGAKAETEEGAGAETPAE